MQLTLFSDISLRMLMYLASREGSSLTPVTVRGAADILGIQYTHLVKVVHQLGREGVLATARGSGGGVRLSRPPAQIRIGEVLRKTEGHREVIDCAKPPCPLRGKCLLKNALDRAAAHFFEEMDQYTLADLAGSPGLQTLISISA